jgi:signal peptidase I
MPRRHRPSKKILQAGIFLAVLTFVLGLPILAGTSVYPFAVVDGNSMYPKLQDGDLVFFKGINPDTVLPNGTIILFIQSYTGIPQLDALTRPIVIHRIINSIVEPNGSILYQTKGDNNALGDPGFVGSNHILGTPYEVIPKVGFGLMFLDSAQGLISIAVVIMILYLTENESKIRAEEQRKMFLGAIAQMVLNNEMSENTFRKIELAIEYGDGLQLDLLRDNLSVALVDWLKKGGLGKWSRRRVQCQKCGDIAWSFEGTRGNLLVICPNCTSSHEQ